MTEVEALRKESEKEARETETELVSARQVQRHSGIWREYQSQDETDLKQRMQREGDQQRQPNAATTGVVGTSIIAPVLFQHS